MNQDPSDNEPSASNPYQSPISRELPTDEGGMRLPDLYAPLVVGITASGVMFAVIQAVYTALTVSWGGLFRESPSEFFAMLIFSVIAGGILAFLASLICVGVTLSFVRVFSRTLQTPATALVIGTAAGVISSLAAVMAIAPLERLLAGVPLVMGGAGGFAGARRAVRQQQKAVTQDQD